MAEGNKKTSGFYHEHGDGVSHYHTEEVNDKKSGTDSSSVHMHSHGSHGHTHTHTQTKAVMNRLSRAIGHLESVKRMVEDGRDCSEVLIQLAAVRAAITNTGKVILKDHIEHCMIDAVETKDFASIEELNKAIERFID